MASFVKQMGNIEFLMLAIGSVVFFTLLLVTGNTMAISVRERTRRAGGAEGGRVLATAFVLVLVLAEIDAGGRCSAAGSGIGLAKLFTLRGDPTGGMLPFFYLPPQAIAAGLGLALAVGLVAGMLPALSAMRLQVVDALRRV